MSLYKKVYNELVKLAQKRVRDQITNTEWNIVVSTLALQLNQMGANLDTVHEQLNSISDLDEEAIADILNRLDTLQNEVENMGDLDFDIIISNTAPVGKKMWIDTSEDAMVGPSLMGLDAPGYEPTPLSEGPTMEEPEGEPTPEVQGHQM